MKSYFMITLLLIITVTVCGCGGKAAGEALSSSSPSFNDSSPLCGESETGLENSLAQNESAVSTSSHTCSNPQQREPKSSSSAISSGNSLNKYDWQNHPSDYKLIVFTFDDALRYSDTGTNTTMTIINALNKYEGAGTLFCTGNNIESNGTALLEYAIEHGFELGNHTYTHAHLKELSKDGIINEIVSLNRLIEERLGVVPKYCRPGYLECNKDVYDVCTELGMPIISRNIDCAVSNWDSSVTADAVKSKCLSTAYDGEIVLMHSWSQSTGRLLNRFVPSFITADSAL